MKQLLGFNFGDDNIIQQKYGVIKTSILQYITPTMITVLVMCSALVFLNYGQLYENYSTNIPLNSLILVVFLFAIVEAFNNNLNIFNTARFFKKMEEQISVPVVNEQAVMKLKKMLDTSAYLINTQNTFKLLDNLQKYGHPLITDNDARLIKTKLGFRIRNQRASVSFMAGLLVMLGLIGTFWGLLLTIGSVGEAMDVIAEQAEGLGSSEGSGIGGIIESISAPLQGMGLAFSSSLFGLAGSLVAGFFNYACSQAQDKAIEDFSRWIDENIPTVGSEEAKLLKLEEPEKEDLNSESNNKNDYIPASSNTNDFIRSIPSIDFDENFLRDLITQIIFTLKRSMEGQDQLNDNFDSFISSQKAMHELMVVQNETMQLLKEAQVQTNLNMNTLSDIARNNIETNRNIQISSEQIANQNEQMNTQLVKEHQTLETGVNALHNRLKQLEKALNVSNNYFSDMHSIMKTDQQTYSKLVNEVMQVKGKIPQSEYENLRKACNHIASCINSMEKSLQDNVDIMKEVAKDGNMDRMARILKEMQVFWLQMKQNAFDVVKKGSTKK